MITVPVGVFLVLLAQVFLRGRYMGLVAGYTEKGIADAKGLGRFVGGMLLGLGIYQLIFPLTVRFWGGVAFVVFVFVVAGFGIAILIGNAWYEKG